MVIYLHRNFFYCAIIPNCKTFERKFEALNPASKFKKISSNEIPDLRKNP